MLAQASPFCGWSGSNQQVPGTAAPHEAAKA